MRNTSSTNYEVYSTIRAGKHLWRSSIQPLWQGSHLEQLTWECVLVGFEYLQTGKLHDLPRQHFSVFCHPLCKKIPSHAEVKLFSLWPWLCVLLLGTTEKPGTLLLAPAWMRTLLSPLQTKQAQLPLSSHKRNRPDPSASSWSSTGPSPVAPCPEDPTVEHGILKWPH